jgi:hypothetical protein
MACRKLNKERPLTASAIVIVCVYKGLVSVVCKLNVES